MTQHVTTSRRQKEKEDRREAILTAARDVFFEEGIHRATVDSIAARAEVAKGTVYLYFESKETLLAHLLIEGLDALNLQLRQAYEAAPLPAAAKLRALAEAYFDYYTNAQDYFRLMMAFDRGRFQEAVKAEIYDQIFNKSLDALHLVTQAVKEGMTDTQLAVTDPQQAAGQLWAAITGVLVMYSHPLRRDILAHEVHGMYVGVFETMLKGMTTDDRR